MPVWRTLFSLLVLALLSCSTVSAKEITIERTYSVTRVTVPQRCELESFRPLCTHLVNFYARRFEREMVMYLNQSFTLGDMRPDAASHDHKHQRSEQIIKMYVYSEHPDDPVFTLFSIFEQNRVDSGRNLLVETINFDTKTGRSLSFADLFKNPDLAAMLCARAIEAEYSQYHSPLLPVVIAATELNPTNYLITPRGLRFFFAPKLVRKDRGRTESVLIPLEKLKNASPHEKWWRVKDYVITEQQKERLSHSQLSEIITLEDTPNSKERLAQAKAEDQANRSLDTGVREDNAAINSGSTAAFQQ